MGQRCLRADLKIYLSLLSLFSIELRATSALREKLIDALRPRPVVDQSITM